MAPLYPPRSKALSGQTSPAQSGSSLSSPPSSTSSSLSSSPSPRSILSDSPRKSSPVKKKVKFAAGVKVAPAPSLKKRRSPASSPSSTSSASPKSPPPSKAKKVPAPVVWVQEQTAKTSEFNWDLISYPSKTELAIACYSMVDRSLEGSRGLLAKPYYEWIRPDPKEYRQRCYNAVLPQAFADIALRCEGGDPPKDIKEVNLIAARFVDKWFEEHIIPDYNEEELRRDPMAILPTPEETASARQSLSEEDIYYHGGADNCMITNKDFFMPEAERKKRKIGWQYINNLPVEDSVLGLDVFGRLTLAPARN